MSIYVVRPKLPCLIIFGLCLFIHAAVFIYGCINVVWYVMVFTFVMCVLYIAAIVFTVLRMNFMSMLTAGGEAFMLFLQIVAFILVIVIVAGKPVEGIDIVYQIFPSGENYIPSKSDRYLYRPDATYNTLAWALFICMLLFIVVNIIGLLATIYNLAYRRYYEDDQIVTRA